MKTNEVYTATLMDLRSVDAKVFTHINNQDIQALINNPKLQLGSLLKQAKKDIFQWTYGSMPTFYEKLSKPNKYNVNYADRYPYMIMFAVQGMEVGTVPRARYENWKSYMSLMTEHVGEVFSEYYGEKYANTLLSETDREALTKALYERPLNLHALQFVVKRLEKIKLQYPSASKLLDPIIKFYQEWDVFSHVNNELKKITVTASVMVSMSKLDDKLDTGNDQPVSSMEQIGKIMFGEVWVAQLSRKLKNEEGKPLPQSSLKSMRDRNTFPLYIQKQLPAIYEQRMAEMKSLSSLIYPDSQKAAV